MLVKDHLGFQVELAGQPQRIISLVPSQTELLSDLGLEDQVVGITRFCVHPENWRKTKALVGGTKKADLEKIEKLKPDLIIANKEENDRQQIEAMRNIAPVFTTDVRTFEDASNMITDLGKITGASSLAAEIRSRVKDHFRCLNRTAVRKTCIYLIWNDPMMTVSRDTYIHDMLQYAGLENAIGDAGSLRYPEITPEDMYKIKPQVILLSSEPYPFKAKHLKFFSEKFPQSKVALADGEMFSWYGSRLLKFDPSDIQKALGIY